MRFLEKPICYWCGSDHLLYLDPDTYDDWFVTPRELRLFGVPDDCVVQHFREYLCRECNRLVIDREEVRHA